MIIIIIIIIIIHRQVCNTVICNKVICYCGSICVLVRVRMFNTCESMHVRMIVWNSLVDNPLTEFGLKSDRLASGLRDHF